MSRTARRLAFVLKVLTIAGALAAILHPAAVAQVTVTQDANHHYLDVNGVARPLIGLSSEYLPHVTRPAHTSDYCTFANYTTCIDNLANNGLNTMQLWLMMDNSVGLSDLNPGLMDTNCPAFSSLQRTNWTNDQPFLLRSDNRWNLDLDNFAFLNNVNAVLSYAASKNVIVEVTLFDAFSGSDCTSPWHVGNNINSDGTMDSHFTDRKYFTSFDNDAVNSVDCAMSDSQAANQIARRHQIGALGRMITNLNSRTNFYWNIANEPDESPLASTTTSTAALLNWHNCIALKIALGEASLPHQHLIGVNFWTDSSLKTLATSGNQNINIASGHYSSILCTSPPGCTGSCLGTCATSCPCVHSKSFYGAIPALDSFYSTLPNAAFGFNETKSTPSPSLATARAEAWEFLVGEGAAYDNYNLNRSDPNTTKVLGYLNYLRQFLSPLALTHFTRQPGTTLPLWVVSGLSAYPPTTQFSGGDGAGLGNTYWSAMQWSWNQYALYIHHSSVPDPMGAKFKSYAPCYKASGYQNNFTVGLGGSPGYYYAEWFAPDQVAVGGAIAPLCTNNINWTGSGTVPLASPKYPYDLALRIQRCPNGVGPCAIEKSCSGLPVPPLPPEDTRRLPACSPGS